MSRRRLILLAVALVGLAVAGAIGIAVILSRADPEELVERIKAGMSRAEVIAIMGPGVSKTREGHREIALS